MKQHVQWTAIKIIFRPKWLTSCTESCICGIVSLQICDAGERFQDLDQKGDKERMMQMVSLGGDMRIAWVCKSSVFCSWCTL